MVKVYPPLAPLSKLLIRQPLVFFYSMMNSRTINISISSEPQVVYDFVSNLENLPRWAPETFPSIKEMNEEWVVETQQEKIKVVLAERNNFGILDHYVKLTSGVEIYIPMRVVKNADGSEVMLTVFQTPEMTDEVSTKDVGTVEKDLNHLKVSIEES